MTPREMQIEKIRSIKAELKTCRKGTPHWKDLNRHLQKEKKELMMYDILRTGGTYGRGKKNAEEVH